MDENNKNNEIGTKNIDSDEEYQDAVNDAFPSMGCDNEVIEEITQKQSGLTLSEEYAECESESLKSRETKIKTADDEQEDAILEREKSMSEEEILLYKDQADKMKLEGNELFRRGNAEHAIEIYTNALKTCPTKYLKERAILYGNRAAAKVKLGSEKAAIEDCDKAIELWPDYVRVLLRRAKLYEHNEKLDEALADYKRVCELDPSQREAFEAIVRLPPLINERNERLKEQMVSNLKDLGNMILKPFGLSTSNFKMQQDPNTGSYSINFNQS